MKRVRSIALAVLLSLSLLPALCVPAAASAASDVLALVNSERAAQGLAALTGNNQALNRAAQKRAQEIAVSFSHNRPDGTQFSTVFGEYGLRYTSCAENIAYGYADAAAVMEGWMNSSGHRANILGGRYTEIGIGVHEQGGRYYWAQLFSGGGTAADSSPAGNQNTGASLWVRAVSLLRSLLPMLRIPKAISDFFAKK